MELDLVGPVAVAVVGAQDRGVLVGLRTPLLELGRTGGAAQRGEVVPDLVQQSGRDVPFDRLREDAVGGEDVVADQWGSLVRHGVGGACHGWNLPGGTAVVWRSTLRSAGSPP